MKYVTMNEIPIVTSFSKLSIFLSAYIAKKHFYIFAHTQKSENLSRISIWADMGAFMDTIRVNAKSTNEFVAYGIQVGYQTENINY